MKEGISPQYVEAPPTVEAEETFHIGLIFPPVNLSHCYLTLNVNFCIFGLIGRLLAV
jgi:hypothetical protein